MPYLPAELGRASVRTAVVPALGLSSFAVLLTTASLLGVPLGGVSITARRWPPSSSLLALASAGVESGSARHRRRRRFGRELLALLALAAIAAFALASSWDIAYPFQARGTDWGHYLLYADQVAAQGHLLIDDPLAAEDDRIFADPPAVGALYGSVLVLDGVSSWSLTAGIAVLSALTVLSVYAAAAALWGNGAGLVAAGAFAVAPIRLDPAYWHGLGTTFAIVFVPLVVMSLGLLFRGARGWRQIVFLAVVLLGVAAAHATSAIVVGAFVIVAPLVDSVVRLRRGARATPGRAASLVERRVVTAACVRRRARVRPRCGGSRAPLGSRSVRSGTPVGYALPRPGLARSRGRSSTTTACRSSPPRSSRWRSCLTSRRLREDPALLALASLALACVLVSQLWRVARLVRLPARRLLRRRRARAPDRRRIPPSGAHVVWIAAFVVVLVFVARASVGLRLPERVVQSEPRAAAVSGLVSFKEQARPWRAARHESDRQRRLPALRRALPRPPADAAGVR